MEMDTGVNKRVQFGKTMKKGVEDALSKEARGKNYFKVKNVLDSALDEEEIDVEEATGASSSGSYSGPLFGKMENESDDKVNKVSKIKNSDLEYNIRESLRRQLREQDLQHINYDDYSKDIWEKIRAGMTNWREKTGYDEKDDGKYVWDIWHSELSTDEQQEFLDKSRLSREQVEEIVADGLNAEGGIVVTEGLETEEEEEIESEEEEMDEETGAGSSGAYSQPAIWAKNKKNWRAVSDKNFPKLGGPGGTYVKVKEKCRHFPYCNQGDINALEFYESDELVESIGRVSKRIGKPKSYIAKVLMETMDNSTLGKKLKDTADDRAKKSEKKNKKTRITKEELEEIITRSFYKSPVTDPKAGIVGVAKMDLPIGKMFSMSGNKPKYE